MMHYSSPYNVFQIACISTLSCPLWCVSVQHNIFPHYPLLMCFSSVRISTLSSRYDVFSSVCIISTLSCPLRCVSVPCVFPCYPGHDVFQFSMYFCAIPSLCCVSVQCVFPCYPVHAMFQFSMYFGTILSLWCWTLCISVLSSAYAVFHYPVQAMFQFSMYFGAILMMSSVQRVFPCYPLLVLCFSSACISVLSSPCAVFQFSVYFRASLSLCCVSVQRVFPC